MPTNDDTDVEVTETVQFTVEGVAATGSILDNDNDKPTIVSVEPGAPGSTGDAVVEGNALIFTVTLSEKTLSPFSYTFTLGGGTASAIKDYSSLDFSAGVTNNDDGTITVAAGITSFTATLPTNDDTDVEATETVQFTVEGIAATGSILDNDHAAVMVSIVATEFSGSEGGLPNWALGTYAGADTLTLSTRSGPGENPSSVGTAEADTITTDFYMDNSMFDTGVGADTVTFTSGAAFSGSATNAHLYTGGGAETLTITFTLINSIVDTGTEGSANDADTVTLVNIEAGTVLLTRSSNDTITVKNATDSAVFSGEGNDTVTVINMNASVLNAGSGLNILALQTVVNDSCVVTGDDRDIIRGSAGAVEVLENSSINAGNGNNNIDINEVRGTSTIITGDGNDIVALTLVKSGFDGNVTLGSGNDKLTMSVGGTLGANAMFDGGSVLGADSLTLTGITKLQWDAGIKNQFVNFETVTLNGSAVPSGDLVFTGTSAVIALHTHGCDIEDWMSTGVVFTVSRDLDNGKDSTVKFTLGAIAGSELEAVDIAKIIITDATGLVEITGLTEIKNFLTNGQDVKLSGSADATVMLMPVSDSLIENIEAFSGNVEAVVNGNASISGTGTDFANFRDTLDGGETDKMLIGDSSNDILSGGNGDDFIFGGLGDDKMTGGIGIDSFVFGENKGIETDTIVDFNVLQGDKLDLSDLLTGENPGNLDNYLSFLQDGKGTLINVKASGSGSVDHVIKLENLDLTNDSKNSDTDIINNLLANNLIID